MPDPVSPPGFGSLRSMKDDDLAIVLDWRNHPSIRDNMYTQHEISPDEHRAWWDRVSGSPKFRFYIFERDGTPTGYVAFSEITPLACTAVWGFYTAPGASQGTGSQMTFLAMDEAFGPLGLRKLNAEAIGRNAASLGLHERFGFQREGLFRDHVMIGDTLGDVHRLALFSDDWKTLRAAKLQTLSERLPQ